MIECLSKNHDIIKDISKNLKKNQSESTTIVDDLFVLTLLKKYNIKVHTFIYCNDFEYREESSELINYFSNIAKTYTVSLKTMTTLTQKENSCNIIAVCDLNIKHLTDFKDKEFIIICDGLEIPGNLGTIYRTSDACTVDGIILVDTYTKLNNPKLVHSSRGMNIITETVNSNFEETIKFLEENNFNIYVGEPEDGTSYTNYDYEGKTAIIVGSERYGSNKNWLNHEVNRVFIPMNGEITSLNVGVAASVLMYKVNEKKGRY